MDGTSGINSGGDSFLPFRHSGERRNPRTSMFAPAWTLRDSNPYLQTGKADILPLEEGPITRGHDQNNKSIIKKFLKENYTEK